MDHRLPSVCRAWKDPHLPTGRGQGRTIDSEHVYPDLREIDWRLKTRIRANWSEARGFTTCPIERRFGSDSRVQYGDPALALCGVDNPQARAILEEAGFATVFEAGLGDGTADFRRNRTYSFPGPIPASSLWADDQDEQWTPGWGHCPQPMEIRSTKVSSTGAT